VLQAAQVWPIENGAPDLVFEIWDVASSKSELAILPIETFPSRMRAAFAEN
jgi:hypothetical protein